MRSFVVVGMALGDEGKGSVVDWLTREEGASLVVRFNGGAQAAHHVVCDDGLAHTFNQFGSGTLAGAMTYLSEDVLVNPLALATEAEALMDLGVSQPLGRITISPFSVVTTPWHVALNRLREMSRGADRHGSCGMGIAETMVDALSGYRLRYDELLHSGLRQRLRVIRDRKFAEALRLVVPADADERWTREMEVFTHIDELDWTVDTFQIVANAVRAVEDIPTSGTVIFEGAQGILLDQDWGFAPYNTWSETDSFNARKLIGGRGETTVLGVVRAYLTRHGRGPFPTEVPEAKFATPDSSNSTNAWQEDFRLGWPDLALLRYAARVDGHLDGLVVTCLDKLQQEKMLVSTEYDYFGEVPALEEDRTERMMLASPNYDVVHVKDLPGQLANAAGVPLYAVSSGPTASSKRCLGVAGKVG